LTLIKAHNLLFQINFSPLDTQLVKKGKMFMLRKLIQVIALLVAGYSSSLFAVGLGEYQLNSGLNQPFNAEIQLLSVGDFDDHELKASLASNAEFEKVGVEKLFILNELRFEIIKNSRGRFAIKVFSRAPIKEPFLNFLVELNWPNGRIIREYTFLLDPPIFDNSTSSTIQKAEAKQPISKPPVSQKPRSRPSAPSSSRTQEYGGNTYTVAANDTLWGIASRVKPSGASVHQMLVAIYRANPQAFTDGNINKLSRGEVLNIPTDSEASQIPHRAALQDVVMQNKQWQSGGARQIVDNNQQSKPTKKSTSKPRLSLAAPSDGEGEGGSGSGYGEELSRVQEELVSVQEESAILQAENEELRARLNDVLKKLEETQSDSLVNLEDTELAALTQSDQLNQPNDSELESTEADATDSVSTGAEQAENDGLLNNEESTQTEDSLALNDDQSAIKAETNSEDQKIEAVKETVKPKNIAPAKPESFIDSLLSSGMALWAGIAAIVVLIILAVFWRMRKQMQESDFQDDLVASTGANSIDGNEDFELPEVGDEMLVQLDMDDDSDKKVESDNETFDALGEADIYIAYGKFDEAEKLLKDAIDENPIRSDLKVKLMECYSERQNKDGFEELAIEVSQAVDADEWLPKVKEMREASWAGEGGEESFDIPSTEDIFGEGDDDDFTSEVSDAATEEVDLGLSDTAQESLDDDFSLDEADSNVVEEEFDVSLDLPDELDAEELETFDSIDDDESVGAIEDVSLEIESGDDDTGLSLDDTGLSDGDLSDMDLNDTDLNDMDLNDDDFSFDDDDDFSDEEGESSGDEISTKLDLARAYIDMGDAEGAQEILSEVLSEGTDDQKQEAQELIGKLG
jgi:pilus assembly protein FimV